MPFWLTNERIWSDAVNLWAVACWRWCLGGIFISLEIADKFLPIDFANTHSAENGPGYLDGHQENIIQLLEVRIWFYIIELKTQVLS